VKLTAAKIWEAGVSMALLRNAGAAIPTVDPLSGKPIQPEALLSAVRIPADYNVQIVSATPDSPEIHFTGKHAQVGIKNAEPFNYRFSWKLHYGDKLVDGGYVDLPSNSTRYFEVALPAGGIWQSLSEWLTTGTLKDDILKGSLILEPDFGAGVNQPLHVRDLAATLRFSRWGSNAQWINNAVFVFLLLGIGGVGSIWVNCGIPNTRRALVLRRRIHELELKISGLDSSIDSRGRVMLSSHLPAIREVLEGSTWRYPSFTTTLDQLTSKVDMVQEWVEIVYSVSLTLNKAWEAPELFPPTVLNWIQQHCDAALAPIESGFTKSEEIDGMKADLKAAQQYLEIALSKAPNPDLEKVISEREANVAGLIDSLGDRYQAQFGGAIQEAKAAAARALKPPDYISRDTTSLKIDLLRIYDERIRQAPASAVAAAVGGGGGAGGVQTSTALSRLQSHAGLLVDHLVPDTHESLRIAQLIIDEMRQDIYADADGSLMGALKNTPPAVMITHDPATLTTYTPVRFALRFDRQILNEAVARQEWRCAWDFGDGSPREFGWEVFHSFMRPGNVVIKVAIHDLMANPVTPSPTDQALTIHEADSSASWFEPETKLEMVRLAIVLTLALFALLATAQQKVQTLGFFEAVCAVIALGFSADTVKNLVLKSSAN